MHLGQVLSSNVNCNHSTCGCLAFNTQHGFCQSLVFTFTHLWTPRIIRKCTSLWSSSSPGVNHSAPVQFLFRRLYSVCWFWCDRPAEKHTTDTVTWRHQASLVGSVGVESSLKGQFPPETRKDLRGNENERTHYHTLSTASMIPNEASRHPLHQEFLQLACSLLPTQSVYKNKLQ